MTSISIPNLKHPDFDTLFTFVDEIPPDGNIPETISTVLVWLREQSGLSQVKPSAQAPAPAAGGYRPAQGGQGAQGGYQGGQAQRPPQQNRQYGGGGGYQGGRPQGGGYQGGGGQSGWACPEHGPGLVKVGNYGPECKAFAEGQPAPWSKEKPYFPKDGGSPRFYCNLKP